MMKALLQKLGVRSLSRCRARHRFSFLTQALISLCFWSHACVAAADFPAAPELFPGGETNSHEILRSYLQLQEQLHETHLAIQRNQQEAQAAAEKNAQAFTSRLQGLEQSLSAQRSRELEAMQSSNRTMLVIAGAFAGIGCLAMLALVLLQWRSLNGHAKMLERLYTVPTLPALATRRALGAGDPGGYMPEGTDLARQRLFTSLDRLEHRIRELEITSHGSLSPWVGDGNGSHSAASSDAAKNSDEVSIDSAGVGEILARSDALLAKNQPAEALDLLESALRRNPKHVGTLVKRGVAFERLGRLEEAMGCYDQAVTLEPSTTIAYVHKGSIFNRLGRFVEAAECYEQALRLQSARP